MAHDRDDDAIGYGRPPRWSQFRKGQSGNPNGRPKKEARHIPLLSESEADRDLRNELDRKVTVTDADGTRKEKMCTVVARAQINAAARGNPIAQRDVRKAQYELEQREAERAENARKSQLARDAAWFNHLVDLKAKQSEAWEAALSNGLEEPESPWPHPDDIILDFATRTADFRGPCDARDVPIYVYHRAQRDFYHVAAVMNLCQRDSSVALCGIYDALWRWWDATLPLRWQLTGRERVREFNLMILTPSALRKHLHRLEADSPGTTPVRYRPVAWRGAPSARDRSQRPFLHRE